MASNYLSDQDLADRFGICRTSVWRWLERGMLPQPVRLGPNTTRWRLADIEAFEAQRLAATSAVDIPELPESRHRRHRPSDPV